MSDEDLEGLDNGPKALREAYEKQKADMAALQKELAEFRTQARANTLASTLKAKGLDEAKAAKVAKFYTNDDTSEAAVGQWLEANADVFGIQAEEPQAQQAPGMDPNAMAAARLLGATFNQVTPAAQANGKVVGNPEEIAQQIRSMPYEDLQRFYGKQAFPDRPGPKG